MGADGGAEGAQGVVFMKLLPTCQHTNTNPGQRLTPLNTAAQNSIVTLCSALRFSRSLATASCVLMYVIALRVWKDSWGRCAWIWMLSFLRSSTMGSTCVFVVCGLCVDCV